MKNYISTLCIALLFIFNLGNAQGKFVSKKVKVFGKIIDQNTKQPLDYATITLVNSEKASDVAGGITNEKGAFSFDVNPAIYNIKVEYISYKPTEINQKSILIDTDLGTISMSADATQLNEVQIRSEKTSVEIKLDKKVYSVGKDILVRGGTVSDVLDNIPSVAVDQDGTVSLRGNENVRILIDGKPSNAINITEALRQIPADAIDKVEVVTNPSARYDSEGGGGLLNIILKKGRNQGINGSVILSTGDPRNYGISTALNFKSEKFNLFSNVGYNYRKNPGNVLSDGRYKNNDGSTRNYIDERRYNERIRYGLNYNLGADFYLDKNTTWTHAINFRENDGTNPETVSYFNYDANRVFKSVNFRINDQVTENTDVEYSTNFVTKFKREGHKLSVDGAFSVNKDSDLTNITDAINERTSSKQNQSRNIIQTDYVMPFGKASQFEAGYKGEFSELVTDFQVGSFINGVYTPYPNFSNILQYTEKINALYSQLGTKINKFSFLFGLRWEDSNIGINQLSTQDFNQKKYNNFFPSAFITYELANQGSVSLSYSRRISRPRGRQINPFSGYSSNISLFQGNPDLDPALTDAIDFGFLKKWSQLTFNTSVYTNRTTDSFQFVRKETGSFVDIAGIATPVIVSTPINLATETRYGFEFTLNYSPYKWLKLNSNFNFFQVNTRGTYTYTNFNNQLISQNFDNDASSWFTRLTSRVSLPLKIDWQTNFTYNGPQNNAQGKVFGVYGMNIGFSKDVLKDKATIAVNVQDVFNSRKRIFSTDLPNVSTYVEFQRTVRQINLSFTYRFIKKKNEKEKPARREGEDDFQG
jgi:outer membrane receptor for ferrienterochelin and colicins